jgi:hypothetical protein
MKFVLAAAAAFFIGSAALAQQPDAPLLGAVPPDATTIANYYKQAVYDPTEDKIGQIIDLLIDKDGMVPVAMISVGSFLKLKKKVVAVRFTALQMTQVERKPHLTLETSRRALRDATAFQYNRSTQRWEPLED